MVPQSTKNSTEYYKEDRGSETERDVDVKKLKNYKVKEEKRRHEI